MSSRPDGAASSDSSELKLAGRLDNVFDDSMPVRATGLLLTTTQVLQVLPLCRNARADDEIRQATRPIERVDHTMMTLVVVEVDIIDRKSIGTIEIDWGTIEPLSFHSRRFGLRDFPKKKNRLYSECIYNCPLLYSNLYFNDLYVSWWKCMRWIFRTV